MTDRKHPRVMIVRNGGLIHQHHLTTLCRFLIGQGFEVQYLALQCPRDQLDWFEQEVPGIKTTYVGLWSSGGLARFLKGGQALRRLLHRGQFDILYVIDSWTLPFVFVATLGRMRSGLAALVYHTFDMITPHAHGRFYFALERWTARRSQLNVNTDRTRAQVAKMLFNLPETPLSVPLRLSRDAVLPARDATLRASVIGHAPKPDEILVVYPTALRADRMTREVILAFASLPDNYHLVTIDTGGSYAEKCRALISRHHLQARIHLLDPMPHEAIVKLCACADIGLIFHDVEAGLGNYLCHPGRLAYFVALGLPFVASDVPVLEALVYRHGLGACCSPYDPGAISSAIRLISDDPRSLLERHRMIREWFERELNYEKAASSLTTKLREMLL